MTNRKIIFCFTLLFILLLSSFAYADDLEIKETPSNGEFLIDTSVEQLRVSPSDTSGLHAIMLTLIGDYNPIVKDYTYQSQQGYTSHSIDIQPDYSWLASCLVFIVVLFCVFRIIGGIFKNG